MNVISTDMDITSEMKKVDGTLTNEDIDRIFDVRDNTPDSYESHVFDGVFDDE